MTDAPLTPPELAIVRMAATLTATGVPVTTAYLVDRAMAARGILLTQTNRGRYSQLLEDLVNAGMLLVTPHGDLAGSVRVTVSGSGRRALGRQGHE